MRLRFSKNHQISNILLLRFAHSHNNVKYLRINSMSIWSSESVSIIVQLKFQDSINVPFHIRTILFVKRDFKKTHQDSFRFSFLPTPSI